MSLHSIQYARALAALMVVLFHMGSTDYAGRYSGHWLGAGVDIFFVISGFIMYWTTAGRDVTPGGFIRRRLLRIVPLYWLVTTVMVALILGVPQVVRSGSFDLPHVVASYLFVPWMHPVLNYPFPVVVPGWTLNYEMFFYVAFAACLALPERRRPWGLSAVLGGLVLAGWIFDPHQVQTRFYTSTLLLEFLFGTGIGILVRRGRLMPRGLALGLVPVILPALWLLDGAPQQGLTWGLPAAAFVYGIISLERQGLVPRLPLLLLLGNASYSLYLIHPMVLSALDQVLERTGVAAAATAPLPGLGLSLVIIAVTATAGCLCYVLVEQPLGRLAHRIFGEGGRKTVPASATISRRDRDLSPSGGAVESVALARHGVAPQSDRSSCPVPLAPLPPSPGAS